MPVTVEQITFAYEQEKNSRRPPMTADDLPFIYEDITNEWLTAVLCGQYPGAEVVSYKLDAPDDGNTNRRRIHISYNDTGRQAGLPGSVFCKASHRLGSRISNGMSGAIQGEVNFYNTVRPLLPIEAPVSLFARYNSALNSIIMMRELDSRTVFCTHTSNISRDRAENQMRVLAAFHGKFLDSPELKTTLSMYPDWNEFFGKLDYPNFEKACDQGFAAAEAVIPPRLFARRNDIWPATRKSVECHLHLPQTFCHGDDHLRNWYIAANGEMGLTDWQGAHRGHWSRDVIYAISTSLTVENRRAWLDDLLRYYVERLQRASGKTVLYGEALDECSRQLLTVLAYWTSTLNPAPGIPDMQPRDSTLEFIRRIATAIDDLDALDQFS